MGPYAPVVEQLIKASNNVITLLLYEGAALISGAWTQLDIYIGDPALVTITRTANNNGINLTSGTLTIDPGALTESLANLVPGQTYPVVIRVRDATTHTVGAYFGAKDSLRRLFFQVSDPPG